MARNEIAINSENKPKKRRVGNPALTGEAFEDCDNAKFLMTAQRISALPRIDWHDTEQVRQRLNEYFAIMAEVNQKPTVTGMSIALGMSRKTMWYLVNDQYTGRGFDGQPVSSMSRDCLDLIKRAYEILSNLMEDYMENGKINPVTGIFLAKNHFGYQDKQEYVLTPNKSDDFSPADLQQRYLDDSSDS